MIRSCSSIPTAICWIHFDVDESTIEFTTRSPVSAPSGILWLADFPHPDAKCSGATRLLTEAIVGLPHADQQAIAGASIAALYGIDP